MTRRILLPLLVALASVIALAACDAERQASGEQTSKDQQTAKSQKPDKTGGRAEARAGDVTAIAGDASGGKGAEVRAGDVVVRAGDSVSKVEKSALGNAGNGENPKTVTLEMKGDAGTRFTGNCVYGDTEKKLDGRAPERYTFNLDGRKLECRIQKQGVDASALEVVLIAGDDRHEQRIDAERGTVNLLLSGGNLSYAVQSSSASVTSSNSSSMSSSSTNSH